MKLLPIMILGIGCSTVSADVPSPGKQVEQELKVSDEQTVPYLVFLPDDYGKDDKKWPMIFFLHGRGESNGPLSLVAKWGPPRMAARGDKLPYVVVSPQCPRDESWPQPRQQAGLLALLEHVTETLQVDTQRVYLTGLSMGGYGSWRLAADQPHRFAAVAPVCGGGKPEDADKLKDLPIWVFHGDQDKAVPLSRSQEMVDAIRAAGGTQLRFTTMEFVGHNCWSATYATPGLYDWFDQHRRK